MRNEISAHETAMRKRFVASKRHTIEVDFHPYLREIRRERKRAAQRGLTERGGVPLPLAGATARQCGPIVGCDTSLPRGHPPAARTADAGAVGPRGRGG